MHAVWLMTMVSLMTNGLARSAEPAAFGSNGTARRGGMKVAIGSRPHEGPWGGGNRFVRALSQALVQAGHAVVHDLGGAHVPQCL